MKLWSISNCENREDDQTTLPRSSSPTKYNLDGRSVKALDDFSLYDLKDWLTDTYKLQQNGRLGFKNPNIPLWRVTVTMVQMKEDT